MLHDINSLTKDELQFLNDWEEVHKKGIVTFWVLFYLSQHSYDAKALCEVLRETDTSINEHSIYRLLRRLYDVGLIDQTHSEGRNKFYTISDKGGHILTAFMKRNIMPLAQSIHNKEIQ